MPSIKSLLWKAAYRRWRTPRPDRTPGYSMLLPVPGDLPVFLQLALAVARRQDPIHRLETLVIPDRATERVRQIVSRESASWPGGRLRLIELPRPDRWLPGLLNRPHANHWLQLVNGVEAAGATHGLLHDADLFIHDRHFLRGQFERCRDGQFACFGVNRVWDAWYQQHGVAIAATWELMFDMDWLRSFAPHLHLGHENRLNGETHTFDTTLYPQCLTPAQRIDWLAPAGGLVHFNYVICTYRYFQANRSTFADDHFRVLLVRLLVDMFDSENAHEYEAPSLGDLARGLTESNARVTYVSSECPTNYREFRDKFNELLAGPLLNDRQKEIAIRGLAPFNQRFAAA